MKRFLLLFIVLTTVQLTAQRYHEVVKWEATTLDGSKVFGIAKNMIEAEMILAAYSKPEKNSKKPISLEDKKFRYATMPRLHQNDNPFDRFLKLTKKNYKVFNEIDSKTMEIIDVEGFDIGLKYYQRVTNVSKKDAKTKFLKLTRYFKGYMIANEYMITSK